MRTTLTLENDVAVNIERLRRERNLSLKAVINEVMREGLKQLAATPKLRHPFVTGTVDAGPCQVGSIDNVAEVLALAENDAFA